MSWKTSGMPDGNQFAQTAKSVEGMSRSYSNAVASTGMFEVAQHRVNSQTQEFTQALQKQKLGIRDLVKNRATLNASYKEQLRLQQMTVTSWGTNAQGQTLATSTVPKTALKELDTFGNKVGWAAAQIRSASHQTVNWGKNMQWSGRQLMVGLSMPIAAFGAASAVMAYQVDQNLTRVAKVYDTTSSGMIDQERELANVREDGMEVARFAAEEYGSSMNDTLDVMAQLAATGQTGNELMINTKEVMRIATLGEMDYNKALNASISLQSVFKMSTNELSESFNYMNAIENATSLQLEDFATAIPIAAAPVKAMGGDIKTLGTLLVAMRENGIVASQGANAIKAAMTRIYKPSEQVLETFKDLTGLDFESLVASADGEIIPTFTAIYDAVKDLDKIDKMKLLAGLFGTQQSTRLSAILNSMEDLKKGRGQVSDAMEIGNRKDIENQKAADAELKTQQESTYAQFRSALNTLQVDLAKMGTPFLAWGTKFLNVIGAIVKRFTDLPEGVQKWLSIAAILTALIGPGIMLIGLFANLAGNMGKFSGFLLQLATRFNILNKDQKIAAALANASNLAMTKESQTTATLATQMLALTRSMDQATAAQTRFATAAGLPIAPTVPAGGRATAATSTTSGYVPYVPTRSAGGGPSFAANSAGGLAAKAASQTAAESEKVAAAAAKTKTAWLGAAGAMVTAGSLLTLMNTDSGSLANNMAQVLLTATLLTPMFMGLGGMIGKAGIGMAGVVAATKTGAAGATGMIASMKGGFAGLVGSLSTFGKFLGVGGLVVGGLTAGYFLWRKITQESREAFEQQKALNATADKWAESLGFVRDEYEGIAGTTAGGKDPGEYYEKRISDWAKEFPEVAKALDESSSFMAKGLAAAGGEAEFLDVMLKQVTNEIILQGGSAKDAAQAVGLMMGYVYKDVDQANAATTAWLETWGNFEDPVKTAQATIKSMTDDVMKVSGIDRQTTGTTGVTALDPKVQEEAAREVSSTFWGAFGPMDQANRAKYFAEFQSDFAGQWDTVLDGVDSGFNDVLSSAGIETGAQLEQLMKDFASEAEGGLSMAEKVAKYGSEAAVAQLDAMVNTLPKAQNLLDLQNEIAIAIAKQGEWGGDVNDMWDLGNEAANNMGKTVDQAKSSYDSYIHSAGQARVELSDTEKLRQLNIERVNAGLKETTNLEDGFKKKVTETATGLTYQTSEIEKQNGLLQRQQKLFKEFSFKDAAKTAWGDASEAVYTDMEEKFESAQEKKMEAIETNGQKELDAHDKQVEARLKIYEKEQTQLDNAQERASGRLQNRQETANDALLKQQDAANTVMETRQEAASNALDNRHEGQAGALENRQEAASSVLESAQEAANNRLENQQAAASKALENRQEKLTNALANRQEAANDVLANKQEQLSNILENSQERASEALENRQEQLTDALARRQEAASDALADRQEKLTDALANRQEAAMDAFDSRWEKHIENVEKGFDKRTEAVNKAIEAEEKAEEIRQRIFDAEKTRIQRMASMMNMNIDFNVAVNTGDLDEAAKIRNDMMATESTNALDDSGMESSTESEKTMEALQKRLDLIDKEKTARLDALQEVQEAQRKALEKQQEREQKALQNRLEAQQKALQKQQEREQEALQTRLENQQKALQKEQEREQKALQDKLEAQQEALQKQQEREQRVLQNKLDNQKEALQKEQERDQKALQNKLERQQKALQTQQERDTKALQDKQEAEKTAQQKRQERERNEVADRHTLQQEALRKQQERETKALEARQTKEDKALQQDKERYETMMERRRTATEKTIEMTKDEAEKGYEIRKKNWDKALEALRSYVPTSEKDLRAHIERVRKEYGDFNGKLVDAGDKWGKIVSDNLTHSINKSALGLDTDIAWAAIGENVAKKLANSVFGLDVGGFKKFVGISLGGVSGKATKDPAARKMGETVNSLHTGGPVNKWNFEGRTGFAKTAAPFQSEELRLLKRDEYVVDSKTHKDYGTGFFEGLKANHSGGAVDMPKGTGPVGLIMAGLVGSLGKMFGNMTNKVSETYSAFQAAKAAAAAAAAGGGYGAGKAGMYGGRSFNESQMRMAAIIATQGSAKGMSKRDIQIGIMTAITESGLALPNQAQSDRDSGGLFQQRPSQGWGSIAQVMDPNYAAGKFFSVLKGVGTRDALSPWMAAQTVQRSAYSDGGNYRPYWDDAIQILAALKKKSSGGYSTVDYNFSGSADKRVYMDGEPVSAISAAQIQLAERLSGTNFTVGQGSWQPETWYSGSSHMGPGVVDVTPGNFNTQKWFRKVGFAAWGRNFPGAAQAGSGAHIHAVSRLDPGARSHAQLSSWSRGEDGLGGRDYGPNPPMIPNLKKMLPQFKEGGFMMSDGLGKLHNEEAVLSKPLTQEFNEGVRNFANGGNNEYTFNIHATPEMDVEVLAQRVGQVIERTNARTGRSRNVR